MSNCDPVDWPDARIRALSLEKYRRRAAGYDGTCGPTWRIREATVAALRLQPGQRVLDVGCGTGTLALCAQSVVGPQGRVYGIDASPEMIARASGKARSAGVDVDFRTGVVEALPFPDASFDLVLNTMMLHHLPAAARARCAAEMRRVLKPGGRVLAVDFGAREHAHHGWLARAVHGLIARIHGTHGHVKLDQLEALLAGAGLRVTARGAVGISNLNYVLAIGAVDVTRHLS